MEENNEMTRPVLQIPLEKCFKKFDQSFNWVKYFSCVVDNLDISNLPEKWEIPNETGLTQRLKTPDDKTYLVDGFKHFAHLYLVRDCIESFSLCLDDLFLPFYFVAKKYQCGKNCWIFCLMKKRQHLKSLEKQVCSGNLRR